MRDTINIVLLQPEIPQNTGNIARTCACAGAALHVVHPMGFQLSERNIRRSGMDYFQHVELRRWASEEAFFDAHGDDEFFLFTGSASRAYCEVDFAQKAKQGPLYLVFGRESAGINPELLERYPERCLRIPMLPERRSLNLSNAAAIVLYEVQRQCGFPGMM